MNKEYIERDAVVKLREEFWKDRCDYMAVRVTNIMNIPAADVAPVIRGEWIFINEATNFYEPPHGDTCKCSECQYIIDVADTKFNYCPNCGAEMNGGSK